ncbi:hypothetical protein [Chryseolinea lacunae]|uniref:Uncharacterized protein n=1 Tax=Chryseolinea lacunae TaxID=2801331 RepID=A0ABS1L252_9BACT|nr:hypothetical protein [Chryseolinea lacunae]MBL0745784.1 hypothetical protein [Chryseolinea lacunae]
MHKVQQMQSFVCFLATIEAFERLFDQHGFCIKIFIFNTLISDDQPSSRTIERYTNGPVQGRQIFKMNACGMPMNCFNSKRPTPTRGLFE